MVGLRGTARWASAANLSDSSGGSGNLQFFNRKDEKITPIVTDVSDN
jgi:hypothetical protein